MIRPTHFQLDRQYTLSQAAAGAWALGGRQTLVHVIPPRTIVDGAPAIDSGVEIRNEDTDRFLDFYTNSTAKVDFGNIPTGHALQLLGSLTILTRFYYRSGSGVSFGDLIEKGNFASNGWALLLQTSTGKLEFWVDGTKAGGAATFGVNANAWNTFGVTRIGTSYAYFLNGLACGTNTNATTPVDNAANLIIGNRGTNSRNFPGSIDYVVATNVFTTPDQMLFLTQPHNAYAVFADRVEYPYGAFADAGGATAFDLDMASLLHGHSLDALSLSSSSALSIQSLLHTHALDALSLTESSALAIRDLLHSHTLDAASLNQASVLAIQDLLHSHTIDGVTLAQIANTALAIADLLHSHTLDSADLSVTAGITIQSLLHTHALDSVDLSTVSVLSIDSLLHTHLLDTLSLSPAVTMAIQSLLHSHGIEAITLTVVETDLSVGDRVILVQADGRTVLIQADGRTITIQ